MVNFKGKNCLVTGGAGFIGSNLARMLISLGANVIIFDNMIKGLGGNKFNLHNVDNLHNIFIQKDIREFSLPKGHRLDYIFSCAAQKDHGRSMRKPFEDIDINCKGILNILEEVRKSEYDTKIIFIGTTTQLKFPIDIYSANKDVGEKYHIMYNKRYGIPTSVVRLPNAYGPRARIKDMGGGIVNFMIGLAFQDKPLTVWTPSQMKTLIYIDDIIDILLRTCSKKADGKVFAAMTPFRKTILEVARAIVKEVGSGKVIQTAWEKGQNKLSDAAHSEFYTNSKKILGWKPKIDFKIGLKKTVEYYREYYDKYI